MTKEKAKLLIEEVIDDYWEDDGYGNTTQHYDDVTDALYMAIGALEQESCEDCISKKAVLDLVREAGKFSLCAMIKDLPLVTPTKCIAAIHFSKDDLQKILDEKVKEFTLAQKWIPCNDELPEDNVTVIASVHGDVYPETRYSKKCGWEFAYEAGTDYWEELDGVDAWMPLPKPYKAESEWQE